MVSNALNVLFKLYKRYYFKKTREVSSNNQFKIPSNRNRDRHGGNISRFFNIILFAKCYYSMHILYHFKLSMERKCRLEDISIMSAIGSVHRVRNAYLCLNTGLCLLV